MLWQIVVDKHVRYDNLTSEPLLTMPNVGRASSPSTSLCCHQPASPPVRPCVSAPEKPHRVCSQPVRQSIGQPHRIPSPCRKPSSRPARAMPTQWVQQPNYYLIKYCVFCSCRSARAGVRHPPASSRSDVQFPSRPPNGNSEAKGAAIIQGRRRRRTRTGGRDNTTAGKHHQPVPLE